VQRVTLYTRQSSTRKFKRVTDKQTFAGGNFPAGTVFVLRYKRGGMRVFETLKDCPSLQAAQERQLERRLDLMRGTLPPAPAPKPQPAIAKPAAFAEGTLMMDEAIDQYLENATLKSPKTASSYSRTMGQFFKSCGNKPVAQATKQDLIDFQGHLRREGLGDRTIHNRIVEVVTFLRHFGVKDVTARVKFVEKKVTAYRPDELKKLFAAAGAEEWLLYQFFLCTGAREQEVMWAEYQDIDFVDGLFTVRAKAGWKPKDFEEREIPIPDFLVAALKQQMLSAKGPLIFPTAEGKKDGHMLRRLQALARRANLPGTWGLHKFRKTYATLQHKNGTDARTIQKRLGHSDLATTLAYLEGEDARSERSRSQVNGTFGLFALVKPAALVLVFLAALFGCCPLQASAQALPNAPKAKAEHRFFDGKNVAFMAASAAAVSADGWTTRQNNADGFNEINPVARPFTRSNGKAALYFGGSEAAIVGGMYLLHKTGHHRIERILPLVAAGVEGFWAAHNAGLAHAAAAPVPDTTNMVSRR
jgi:integrase